MLALVLSTPALHAPSYGPNARVRAARSVRMLTLDDEVDENAMLVRRLSMLARRAQRRTCTETHML